MCIGHDLLQQSRFVRLLAPVLTMAGGGIASQDVSTQATPGITPEDLTHFEASTQRLADEFDTYKPFPDLSVNGKQTLAENIADVAGISASGKVAPELPDSTPMNSSSLPGFGLGYKR